MLSIDKLKYWDLIRELSPAEICELADKLTQLKSLLGLDDDEPGNEIAVDVAGSAVIAPQDNGDPQFTFCLPSDDETPTAIIPHVNVDPPQVRNRPDKPFRLTAEEKYEILERYYSGETQASIAKVMGRSSITVGRLIRSQTEQSSGDKTA